MQFWPFDKQICDVCFVPMGYHPDEVQSNIPDPGITLFKTGNSEWIIEKTSYFITNRYSLSEPCFRFYLRRKSTFYMLTIIVPIAGMIITSSLVFLLPNESGERISYSITIMLALAVFQTVVADEMPKTSEPTAVICVFLLMGMIVSMLSMVIVILNMRLHQKSDTSRLGSWYTLFVKIMARQGCKGHCRNNRVEDDVNEDTTMAANNAFETEKMGKSRKFIDSKADKNGLVFVEPIDNNVDNENNFETVTWKDVSHAVDNMCFIVIAVFTTVGSICCLIYMADSSTLSQNFDAGGLIKLEKRRDVSLIASIHSESYENATKLRGDLLTNYERSVRPLKNLTGVLNINTTVALYALLDVDSVRGVVTLVLALTCSWFDEKLKWNPTDYDGIQKIDFFQNEVSKPPMTLSTPVEFTVLIDSKMFVTVSSNGLALAFNGEVLESNCEFNMQFWPFDKQICDVCFVPMGYHPDEVQSNIPDPGITLFKTGNAEWIIEKTSYFITNRYSLSEPCFRFYLRRKSTFYMLTIIVPIAGMIITSSLVFLLPNESGERISYSITIMLALAVFQTVVADEMPKTSEPTAVICVFLLMGMIVSMLSMVIVILNMRLHQKSDTSRLGS
ncbi:ACHA6-like protein, partial [Mya arenaria]